MTSQNKKRGKKMEIAVYLFIMIFLLFLNGFFVLAEFAAVKIRPTQIQMLTESGDKRAKAMRYIQTHLDEFLSICQVGITFASIGLGFVGEPAIAKLISPAIHYVGGEAVTEGLVHAIALTISYIAVSFLHIVLGELIPKSVAIRSTEKSALLVAYPMIFFKYLFYAPIWLLNSTVTLIFKIIKYDMKSTDSHHSEDEIRVILEQSHSNSGMSFRRLLYMENILDMGMLTIKNAMQPIRKVQTLSTLMTQDEIEAVIKKYRYSRYPLVDGVSGEPLGTVHIKDLYFAEVADEEFDIRKAAKSVMKVNEKEALENVLSVMQRKGIHMAFVYSEDKWIGVATLEDVIEEVIGTIEEEYPLEQPVYLSDYLSERKVLLDVEGDSIISAVRNGLRKIDEKELPLSAEELVIHIKDRERLGETYVGHGLAIPHARIEGLTKPLVVFIRLKKPLDAPTKKSGEKILYLFVLITPSNIQRMHQMFLSHIAGIFESDFLENKLDDNITPKEIYEAIRIAEETMLS